MSTSEMSSAPNPMPKATRPGEASAAHTSTRDRAWRRVLRNRKAVVGAVLLLLIALSALLAPVLATHDPNSQNLRSRLQTASDEHLLGTDHLGRDLYTRILYGGRVSLQVGFISVGIALSLGGAMGILAGFYGGRVEIGRAACRARV